MYMDDVYQKNEFKNGNKMELMIEILTIVADERNYFNRVGLLNTIQKELKMAHEKIIDQIGKKWYKDCVVYISNEKHNIAVINKLTHKLIYVIRRMQKKEPEIPDANDIINNWD